MKKIIIKILHSIRRVLTALRNNCLPIIPAQPLSLSPYEMYVKEEIIKCYETFKPHFKKSIFYIIKIIINLLSKEQKKMTSLIKNFT